MAQTLLLPPSPYSSQRLSQANCNLLFCYSQFSLHVWRNISDNTAPRSSALSTHTGLQPLPSAGDVGHSPSSGMFFLIRGHTASCSLSLKGGGELSSMRLGHHPDLAGHCHHQPAHHWQLWVKPSATQTPAVSKSHAEITLCSSLSYSYVLLSTPWTTVFCSTHQYYTVHFLLHASVTAFPLQRTFFCCRTVRTTEPHGQHSNQAPKEQPAEYEIVCRAGVNFSVVLHIHSVVLGKQGWRPHHTVHAGQGRHERKAQLGLWKRLPSWGGDAGRGFVFSFLP